MEITQLAHSLAALETRLRRLEFHITGHLNSPPEQPPTDTDQTARARIDRLEHGLNKISSGSRATQDLLRLQSTYPELFRPRSHPESTLTMNEQLAIVKAYAPSFHETASRLSMVKEMPIPPTAESMALIAHAPRIERVVQRQSLQFEEIQTLLAQSSRVLATWHDVDILSRECWADWAARLEEVEKQMRRKEYGRQMDEENEQAYEDRT